MTTFHSAPFSALPQVHSTRVVLLTGGNLGDVAATLEWARIRLGEEIGVQQVASKVYSSEPWGFEAPEPFLNQVLVFETTLQPLEVLDRCQQVEREGGRVRNSAVKGYASRRLDVDILFYGDQQIDTPRLQVPHPLMAQREFVLRPLSEVMPQYRHPVLKCSIQELLDRCLQP